MTEDEALEREYIDEVYFTSIKAKLAALEGA